MADSSILNLPANTAPVGADSLVVVDQGSGVTQKATLGLLSASLDLASVSGRLTLESGVPVSTSDQTAKTTLYYTPYKGNTVCLYNGTSWESFVFSEVSLSLSGYTADTNYDIWLYDNAGTLTLESTAWTNATTRATALTLQDGIYVKSGTATRRYLGTIRITNTTGQCEDSEIKRFVWNFNNRVVRALWDRETTSHTYSGTERLWNNSSTNNLLEWVSGLADYTAVLQVNVTLFTDSANVYGVIIPYLDASSIYQQYTGAIYRAYNLYFGNAYLLDVGIGYHKIQIYESSNDAQNQFTDMAFGFTMKG